MIQIEYGPVHSQVEADSGVEQKLVDQLLDVELKMEIPGYRFMPAFLNGWMDGNEHFYNQDKHQFYSGLLSKVLRILSGAEFEVTVNGYPQPHSSLTQLGSTIRLLPDITLYPDQFHAVERALKYRRGVWKMATNAGKTEVSCGLIKAMDMPRTLLLVPRLEIFHQTVERIHKRLDFKPGMAGDGHFSLGRVTVAMFQTLRKRMKEKAVLQWMQGVELLLGDEIHFLSDESYRKVYAATGGETRIGMSGTPFKDNPVEEYRVRGLCGPVLATVSNKELIEQGRSVKPKVVFLEPKVPPVEKKYMELSSSWQTALTNKYRCQLIADLATGMVDSGRQTLILVNTVAHGNLLHTFMKQSTFTHSQASNRKHTLERLKSGEVFCCIATGIFDTGLSVDHMTCLINAAGGKAIHTLLQRLGRLLRKGSKDKETFFCDFWDTFNRVTRDHSRDRWEVMKAEGVFDMMETSDCLPVEALTQVAESGSVLDVIHRKSRKQKWINTGSKVAGRL